MTLTKKQCEDIVDLHTEFDVGGGPNDTIDRIDLHAALQEAYRLGQSQAIPPGWVPLTIEFEPGHPEEVAYGPQRMMDRLKKWLDAYYKMRMSNPIAAPTPQGENHD
jgi:hypothetical protein